MYKSMSCSELDEVGLQSSGSLGVLIGLSSKTMSYCWERLGIVTTIGLSQITPSHAEGAAGRPAVLILPVTGQV